MSFGNRPLSAPAQTRDTMLYMSSLALAAVSPSPAERAIQRISTFENASWEVAEVDLQKIDETRSKQNRARFSKPDPKVVSRYAGAMETGDEFPPLLVAQDDSGMWLLGGIHRYFAALQVGFESFPAIVVRGLSMVELDLLCFADNAEHGIPSTDGERQSQAMILIGQGVSEAKAAEWVGMSKSMLTRVLGVQSALGRVEESGGDPDLVRRSLSDAALFELGKIEEHLVFSTALNTAIEFEL